MLTLVLQQALTLEKFLGRLLIHLEQPLQVVVRHTIKTYVYRLVAIPLI
jgi:hypothetical protein